MAIQIIGNGGVIGEIETSYRALRTTPRPLDHGALGQYSLSVVAPLVVTQAAAGTLFSLRWADATRFMILHRLRLQALQTAAATATLGERYQAFVARSFTVSDSVGTSVLPATNTAKKRTTMGTTLITDMRVSAVAAGLTVGTRTLDANPFMELAAVHTITNINPTPNVSERLFPAGDGVAPFILTTNEGLIVRGPTTVFGAAGTVDLVIDFDWSEVTAY